MAIPNPITGAFGGWFFHAHALHANYANIDFPWTMQARFGGLLSRWKSQNSSNVSSGGINIEQYYRFYHRWNDAPVTGYASGEITESNMIGSPSGVPLARASWGTIWRWAITFSSSTWTGSSYLADGFSRLYLNDVLVSEGTGLTIPRRFTAENQQVQYQVHIFGDTDRVWARILPIVLPTTSQGAMIGSAPSDLLFFDDFDGGLYPNWNLVGGPYTGLPPNAMSMVGGDGGYGLTSFCLPPGTASPCSSGVSYVGDAILERYATYPPAGDPVPLPDARISQLPIEIAVGSPDLTGLYTFPPTTPSTPPTSPDTPRRDLYYGRPGPGSIAKKIPNPTIKTGLIGE